MLKRNLLLSLLFALLAGVPAHAQVTITYTFSNGTTADADQVNADFSALATQALNRTGGTITGNIAVSNGVTIDGVDISAVLSGTGTPTFAGVTITGAGASALLVTGGITAGSGVVGIVDATGKIPALSSTYFASLSGANLTSLNATNLGSGTVPLARLTGITDAQIDAAAAIAWTKVSKAGSSLADLATRSATDLTSGTLPDARFSGTYSGTLTFSGSTTFSGVTARTANYQTDTSSTTATFSGTGQTITTGTASVIYITPTAGTDTIASIAGGVDGRQVTLCTTADFSGFVGGGNLVAITSGIAVGNCTRWIYRTAAGGWYHVN